jgi:hypothetical protein
MLRPAPAAVMLVAGTLYLISARRALNLPFLHPLTAGRADAADQFVDEGQGGLMVRFAE